MKNIFLLLATTLLFASCNDPKENGDLNIQFFLQYKGQPLVMFDTFHYPVQGQKINFTKVAFYVSNVSIAPNNGEKITIKDIDYLDLTNAHSKANAVNGFSYTLKNIPCGTYKNLQFAIGVPANLNAQQPNSFPSNHILSNTVNYWSAWKSYIFSRVEGSIDNDGNNTLEGALALHSGGDEAFVEFDLSTSFSITNKNSTEIGIIIDMEKYFNGNSLYDIVTYPSIHSPEHKPAIIVLRENLRKAVSLK